MITEEDERELYARTLALVNLMARCEPDPDAIDRIIKALKDAYGETPPLSVARWSEAFIEAGFRAART